jgi:hypothetical protein
MRFDIINIKERIAIGEHLSPEERTFVLNCINEATAPTLHDPGNYIGRIEALWAFLSVDGGGEGICGAPIPGLGPGGAAGVLRYPPAGFAEKGRAACRPGIQQGRPAR